MVAEALHLGTQHALENVLRFIRRYEVKGILIEITVEKLI
jgi:hypothetical protein